ncbi:MAG TPA: hypothetical protein VGR63_09535 [Casimicrobiaceae bacterium]|jgi:hypothetical protein|nr:hypothetical protein [Casimicrobiaceae bacterium]
MTSPVDDGETLYRRVSEKSGSQPCYEVIGDRTVFSIAAFNDPAKQPSVDRAVIKCDPQMTRLSIEDGIIALRAHAIRQIGPIEQRSDKGKLTGNKYGVNVFPDPLFGNCSHAQIALVPLANANSTFKRLKESLARLASDAGWTIPPHTEHVPKQFKYYVRDAIMCLAHRFRGNL